jgi:hypothetical protein
MLTVHLRINDAATAKPTPVRLSITGPDGTTFAPLGRFVDFPTGKGEGVGGHLRIGREPWCYVDGSCEVRLPAGVPLRVRATKGPEYRALDQTLMLGPGQLAVRLAVERWSDLRANGWHPGDTRCHSLAPHAALLEAAAEDLDVVNVLAAVKPVASLDGTAYPLAADLLAFSGQSAALEEHGRLVAVNTLNVHPVLGKVGLLYSHRPVFPLTFGGEETDDWSVCDWCDQCHRKGGLVVWVDPLRPEGGLVGGEALVAVVLGKIDAIEVGARGRKQPLLPWVYRLWNAALPVPLAGGSGKDSNRVPLGRPRTYARLDPGDPFTYKSWITAVRAGRTFVTDGPLLSLDVEVRGPGETVDASGTVRVRVGGQSLIPLDKVELVCNGEVVAADPAGLDVTLPVAESCWLAARCRGVDESEFAHSSPVIVRVNGQPLPRRPEAVAAVRRAIEETREWVEEQGRFANPKARQHLLELCDEAARRLEAPG